MMGKLSTEDEGQSKTFKSQVYHPNRGRNQIRGNYHGRCRNNNAYRGHPMYNQNFRGRVRDSFNYRGNYRGNTRGNQRYRNNNNYRRNGYRGQDYDMNRSRSLDRWVRGRRNDRSASNGRSRSGSRVSTNRYRIRCFKCIEYDHLARECPTRQENRRTEQIQQMFSLDDDQTILQTLLIDTEDDIMMITLMGG